MSDYENMDSKLLQKLLGENRTKLQAADAGTGMTHLNGEEILVQKAIIARDTNRMAFYLYERGGLSAEDRDVIAGECHPYLLRTKPSVMVNVQ